MLIVNLTGTRVTMFTQSAVRISLSAQILISLFISSNSSSWIHLGFTVVPTIKRRKKDIKWDGYASEIRGKAVNTTDEKSR